MPINELIGIRGGHSQLEIDGALNGIDRAGELNQHAVAGGLEYAALMFGDQRVQHVTAPGFQGRPCDGFISFHKPSIADHVGGQDRSKAALSAFFGHLGLPPSKGAVKQIVVAPCGGVYCLGLPLKVNLGPMQNGLRLPAAGGRFLTLVRNPFKLGCIRRS